MSAHDPVGQFHEMQPQNYPFLLRFAAEQVRNASGAVELRVCLELGKSVAADVGVMKLVFEGVRELNIDWPSWSVVRFSPVEVVDIVERGLEQLSFRVFEGEGAFAFSCRAFRVEVI